MTTIWKFKLSVGTLQTIQMPAGAQILTAQSQYDDICLWVLVDKDYLAHEARKIEVLCTGGNELDVPRTHIGTVQLNGGDLVFHVFERK